MVHARDAPLGRWRGNLRSMQQDLEPFRFILIVLAGWVNQQQQDINDYLKEENRVLREQLGNKRLRLNDERRRRLAVRAKKHRPQGARRGGLDHHSEHLADLASKADCSQVRRQQATPPRTASCDGTDPQFGGSHGDGEP